MIRASGISNKGRRVILLGLDRENINRLTLGNPIYCTGEPLGVDHDVIVVFSEELETLIEELAKHGFKIPANETQ